MGAQDKKWAYGQDKAAEEVVEEAEVVAEAPAPAAPAPEPAPEPVPWDPDAELRNH